MDIGYVKTKDCRGGNKQCQQHDLEYNKRLRKRRLKEKNRRKNNSKIRGK